MKKRFFFKALLCMPALLFGKGEENIEAPSIGHFSVPAATQISPLVGFGQLLVGEQVLFPQLTGFYTHGHNSYTNEFAPNVIYGISEEFSVFFNLPTNPGSQSGKSHSSGIKDLLLQFEYSIYEKTTPEYILQATLVSNVQFPTGSSTTNPPNGTGSYTYFIGSTYVYMSVNWYGFISPGANFTTTHHDTKFGNSYLYQCGFARYIEPLSPPGWIFDLMIEFDGTYFEKDKFNGLIDHNSGGNIIFITPSIWLSSNRWVLQFGIGFPFIQHLNGHQTKINYLIGYDLGLAIQF